MSRDSSGWLDPPEPEDEDAEERLEALKEEAAERRLDLYRDEPELRWGRGGED